MREFPGATTAVDAADYAVVGAPLDATTSFRPGTRFGPDRVRRFARTFDDYDRHTDQRFTDLAVHDHGDVRAWPDAGAYVDHLATTLDALDAVPLVVGGEHTVSVAGVRSTTPETVVVCDAHLDLHDSYDGTPWSHACATRRMLETADRAVVVGARTGAREEFDRAEADDVRVVAPDEVAGWLAACDPGSWGRTYLSVDVDAADPSVAPGTGTMEPFGLRARTLRDVVRRVAPHAVGFDVVEVSDRDDGQAAALGAKLLRAFVYTHAHADGG